jgi:hypothetical protein
LVRGLTIGLCLLLANGSDATDDGSTARLGSGAWHLQTPWYEAAGWAIILLTDDGCWRLDCALSDPGWQADRGDVERRQGDGWTLVGDVAGGFAQPWRSPWRQIGRDASLAMATLVDWWLAGDTAPPLGPTSRRWRQPRAHRPLGVELPDPAAVPFYRTGAESGGGRSGEEPVAELRNRLITRGRGRGGAGLRLLAHWADGALVLRSTRWPGNLRCEPVRTELLRVPVEAFLPLWPLADVLP